VTWDPRTSCGNEQDKVCAFVVPYVQNGPWIDAGCGARKMWPTAIGIDARPYPHSAADIVGDISDLSMFADGSMGAVVSSHALEDFPFERVPAVLSEWWRVIRRTGCLVLYLPHADLYPHVGEPGANPAHKFDPTPDLIIDAMKGVGSWTLLENEVRSEGNEYSFFQVYRRDE
jgi:predicted SAM-dependent methyltransferase